MMMLFYAVIIAIIVTIVAGGGTRIGFVGDVFVQVAAVLLGALAFWTALVGTLKARGLEPVRLRSGKRQKQPTLSLRAIFTPVTVFAGILATVFAAQLMPLPMELKAWLGDALESPFGPVSNSQSGTFTISHTPAQTWASVGSWFMPIALFLGVAQLRQSQRERLVWVIVGLAIVSALLGLAQVMQGSESKLRLFDATNVDNAVGFFANRNHLAALFYCTLPLLAALLMIRFQNGFPQQSADVFVSVVLVIAFVFIAICLAQTGSRMGIILSVIALLGITAMSLSNFTAGRTKGRGQGRKQLTILLVVGVTALFTLIVASVYTLPRFQQNAVEDPRFLYSLRTWELALDHLPFGAGVGAFEYVVKVIRPLDEASTVFLNRAHNDVLEVFFEIGLFAPLLLALFAIWFSKNAFGFWSAGPGKEKQLNVVTIQRAASLVIILLGLHSFLDYPLRTSSLLGVFALCCALMLSPPSRRA